MSGEKASRWAPPVADLPWYLTYPFALAVTGTALLVELALRPAVFAVPFVVFFLAVAAASWVGGPGPGVAAILLSALAGNYFFLRPHATPPMTTGTLPTILFITVSSIVTAMSSTLRRRYREREHLLQEAREAHRERLAALEAEKRARAEAEEANRAKDEFFALLGHELRNPLSPIVTALDLIRRRGAGERAREIQIIERQVRHLTRLVDDLLDVTRIARGKVEIQREHLSVGDVVTRSIEMAAPLFESKGHALHVDVAPGLSITGDARRLAQALGNILVNAAKYTDRSGTVWVSARRSGDGVVLSVRDTGAGIAPELLAHVFDPFVQGPRTRDRAEGGLGLGLSLARNLVRLHGGDVTAHSDGPGKGTEIVFTLPAGEPSAGEALPAESRRPPSPDRLRVLVVDDNVDAAQLSTELLLAEGHDVVAAHDGPTAIQTAERFRPDVALLDIGLPVMDGYELAVRLRELLGDRVTSIAVTGYGQKSDLARSAAAGFAAHLVKPVDPAKLLSAVALGRRARARAQAGEAHSSKNE